MGLIIVDSDVRDTVNKASSALESIAATYDRLADVLRLVTAKGGGLSSDKMRTAMESRCQQLCNRAATARAMQKGLEREGCSYLNDIEAIDGSLY